MEKPTVKQETENKSLPKLYTRDSIQRVNSNDLAIIKKYGQQISKLKKDNPQVLLTAISAMIEDVYELANVGKKINANAIIKLSEIIIESYWHLKIDELDIILKKGIKGEYGIIYDRLDATVIFDWIQKYEKSEELIYIYEQNSSEMSILAAEVNLDNPSGWTPPKDRPTRDKEMSILENEKFRAAMKKIIGKVDPVDDGLSSEEHAKNVRAQAELIMKNHKPSQAPE